MPKAKLWSPQRPHLYDLRVELCSDGRVLDALPDLVYLFALCPCSPFLWWGGRHLCVALSLFRAAWDRISQDVVDSYVGIRTVGKKKDVEGHWRLTLNEDGWVGQ